MKYTAMMLLLQLMFLSLMAEESFLILDFEKNVNVSKWPDEKPGEVKISQEWKKEGTHSLRIDAGLMATVESFKTRNWKAYDVLRFHFNNTGPTAGTMGFELRDKHGGFRERHDNAFGIKPGESVVDVDISGNLWRGEENKPYIGKIKTPLETSLIKRMSLMNRTGHTVFVDAIELVKVKKVAVEGAYAFDFGPVNTQVMGQMIGVTEQSSFNKNKGFGFKSASFGNLKKHMSFPTPMLGDGIGVKSGSFNVQLNGGKYIGLIAFERGGFWGDEYSTYSKASLRLNGKEVHAHEFSTDGIDFLFQDTEIENLKQLADKLIWPAHAISTFSFNAVDGENAFTLAVEDARQYPLRIAGLILAPDTAAGQKFLNHHIDLQRKQIEKTFTAGDKSRREGRSKPSKVLVVEELPVGINMYPGDLPLAAAGSSITSKLAVAGQTLTIHLGVYATERLEVEVKSSKASKVQPLVSYGRYMPNRNYGVGSVWLEVNHYRPESTFTVAPDLSRSVILEYKIDKDFGNGVIKDEIELRAGSHSVQLPLEIFVSKVALESIPVPVGLFMNALPIPEKQMESSAWWKAQESLLEEQIGAGLTAVSGGPSLAYNISGSTISGDNPIKYIHLAQKFGPIHAVVSYGGFISFKRLQPNAEAIADAIKALEKKEGLPPHYVNSFDEPRHGTDEPEKVLAYLKPHKAAGLRTIGWSSWSKHEEIVTALSQNSYAVALNIHKPEHLQKVRELGAEPWIYNQSLDRYGMGLHLWRGIQFGAKGRMQWIGLFTQGFAFHNLDGREPSHSCFMVHKTFGVLKTPLWLGAREGLLDVRLRLTLEKLAKVDDPALKLWSTDGYREDGDVWTYDKLEQSRRLMIERISELGND